MGFGGNDGVGKGTIGEGHWGMREALFFSRVEIGKGKGLVVRWMGEHTV